MVGDLGCGKTTFVKGLAKGIGVTDLVTSPSYTISNQYKGNNLTLYHYDLYRLSDAGIIMNEIKEVIYEYSAVAVIEWAEILRDVLHADSLAVDIRVISKHHRLFSFSLASSLKYLEPDN